MKELLEKIVGLALAAEPAPWKAQPSLKEQIVTELMENDELLHMPIQGYAVAMNDIFNRREAEYHAQ